MANNLSGLGREVERLVTAPYAPSLQDLHGLVQHSPTASLSSWALHKPCQVGALADVLIDGLSRSNFALDLVRAFARVESFRNALLERSPYILDQFLQRSIQNGDPQDISACVAMLSSPLPPNFIVPACLASFIAHLISSVGESPCAETILPLYQLMTGLRTTPRVLLEVPSEIMSNLQMELTKTLRNLDDHTGNLLCLATFAQIAASKIAQMGNGQEQCPSWLQNIKHFFGAKRGLKTLDLVVLRVILACSASCNSLTSEQATESIRLALEICDVVEPEQREQWIGANSTKSAKLCEKVTRPGIDQGVQILGATFLVSLLPASALPHNIPGLAPQWLLHEDNYRVLEILPLSYVPRLVKANIACSGPAVASGLFDYVIRASQPSRTVHAPSIPTIQIARELLNGMQSLESQILSSAIAEVAVGRFREILNELVESFSRRCSVTTCRNLNICQASVAQLENGLLRDLFSFYFRSALTVKSDEPGSYLADVTTFGLIMSRTSEAALDSKCEFWEIKPFQLRDAFSSLKIHDQSPSLRQDWRTGIAETLEQHSRAAREDMIQKVEEICYDLEKRCKSVEAPLRAIEEERNRLLREADELNSHNKELYSHMQQASHTVHDLEQTKSRLETEAETVSDRIDKLTASLEAARNELSAQKFESEECIEMYREQARSRELELKASLAEKEDELEFAQDQVEEQRGQIDELTQAVNTMTRDYYDLKDTNDSLEQRVFSLMGKMEEQAKESDAAFLQKVEEIELLQATKTEAEERAEELQNQLSAEARETQRLRSVVQELEDSYKAEMDTLQKDSETQISKITAESEEQRDAIVSLRACMQASACSTTKEIQARDRRIQQLEKKVQHMRDERTAKAREFSEAQQHIGRLMSVMGFKSDPASSKPSGKQQRSRPTTGPSQLATEEMQTHSGDEDTQTQHDQQITESFGLNATPPGQRSPKRSLDNAFSPTSGKKSKESVSRRGTQKPRERKVLDDATSNSQPFTQASNMPSSAQQDTFHKGRTGGETDENNLREIDLDLDLEFSKDFLFTSTSLSEANDHNLPLGTQR